MFTSWGAETPKTFTAADLERILAALDSGEYGAILRAKGILPGSDGASLVRALQDKVLALPDETLVLPGHGPETNIADERVGNPYL